MTLSLGLKGNCSAFTFNLVVRGPGFSPELKAYYRPGWMSDM